MPILTATISYSSALQEYTVKARVDGKRAPDLDYFTNDKKDAEDTRLDMIKRGVANETAR